MGIEEELGFRSSFSLVPERYTVSPELRAELQARGFEVAVHGLTHDGHLFRSYETFSERKPAINRYIKEWGAAGFRSPSMRRNLDWIGELNIEYDSSTFDTDPFEPESTGVETIFPFSVRASNGRSYIELPYSLPQDSTLFLILGEESIRIWKEKLDWVASKGGLALINTHPDYMSFDDRWPSSHMLYPIELYREFLQYARDRYADTMWHQLPCHVAQYCRSVNVASRDEASEVTRPVAPESPKLPSLRGKRVLMIVFSVYPADPRVRRAAEAIVEAGGDVDVLCLQHDDAPRTETIRGVHVSRARLRRKRAQKSRYMLEYSSFVAWASCQAAVRHLRRRYSVVHVHNMPDFLVFSAVVPKLLGAKLILDLHDPVPEMYMTKYSVGRDDRLIRVLTCLERKSLGFADAGITPNKAFRDLFVGRSCPAEEMTIVMNSPQEELFHPGKCENEALRDRQPGRFRLMYHGLIVERHGLDTAVRAVSRLRDEIPGIEFHVYGPGDSFVDTFQDLVNELKASDLVKYYGPIPLEEIAQRIHETDLGIIPNLPF